MVEPEGGGGNHGHSHLPSATFMVSFEFKEVSASTMSRNRKSVSRSKFCESDSLISLTQEGVQKDVQQELDIDFGVDQTFRPLVVNHPSSCLQIRNP